MPVPVVAIHLELPAAPPDVQVLLDACNAGAGAGACVSSADPSADGTRYLAYVSWLDEARQHALVEVGPPEAVRGSFEFRRLKFSEGDPPAERWEAIGLTVATLVGSEAPEVSEVATEPEEPPLPVPPAPAVEQRRWRVGMAARVGSGFLDSVSTGLGATLAYELPRLPLFPVVFGGWRTATEEGITGHWWEAGVGLGAETELGEVRVSLSGLVVGQLLDVSATQAGSSDSGSSSTTGILGALELAWPHRGPVGVTLGAHVLQLAKSTEISSGGAVVVETSRTSLGGSLGLETRF